MSNESMFHKIVSNEDSHTQLLCNTLKREPTLLRDLLNKVGLKVTNHVKPEEMDTQVCLNGCGKADLLIQSSTLSVIFEVKIEPQRQLEETQKLLGKPKSYQCWLERENAKGREPWLVYLVPGNWACRSENEKIIKEYEGNAGQQSINVCQIYWENVLQILSVNDSRTRSPFVNEFRLILTKRFGPINFNSMEIKHMFKPDFPMETVVKLNAVLEGLRARFGNDLKPVSVIYEFGFYLKNGKREMFVGSWREFWNAGHYYPICFGIQDEDPRVKEAFSMAFREEYREDPIPFDDDGAHWTMGWIPQEYFNRFETAAGAINEIWPKLAYIWKQVQ